MLSVKEQLESFTTFAQKMIESTDDELSMDELYDQWRLNHGSAVDTLAIQASLRDMENGERGRPFSEFAQEFVVQKNIQETE